MKITLQIYFQCNAMFFLGNFSHCGNEKNPMQIIQKVFKGKKTLKVATF
jgi:hypothetical protein